MSDPAQAWADALHQAHVKKRRDRVTGDDIRGLMGSVEGLDAPLVEARAQKAALLWLRSALTADPAANHAFLDKTGVPWMDKLLTAARLKELAGVKIAKAGKSGGLRYDIAGLQASWYGRRLLESLGFNKRRTSVTKDEFATVVNGCRRIKLVLPQTIEPTTTERFFADGDD